MPYLPEQGTYGAQVIYMVNTNNLSGFIYLRNLNGLQKNLFVECKRSGRTPVMATWSATGDMAVKWQLNLIFEFSGVSDNGHCLK
jgi:hypothetical protein